ncbi:MAG TPA: amidohydrolase family protein [Pseudomonadales bacterium]|jgi:imidazolonepropionase-like amidohydrolase|nr:amidohydrolase family protein [Gammaproteobacteria bacterium]HIL82008.1 amidohydrolase family protein [Pseudomonadales bacterium]
MHRIYFLLLALSFCQWSFAKTFLIADRYLDVEKGHYVDSPVIVIEDDRILSMTGDIERRQNSDQVINLAGMTLLPGLVDSHVHIEGNQSLHGFEKLGQSDQAALLSGVSNARDMLTAGITTIRNLGSKNYGDIALRDAINDGIIDGPRIFAAGPPLGITGGHCDSTLLPHEFGLKSRGAADGPWEVAAKVRENIKYGSDVIKFCATGGVMSKGTEVGVQQYTLEEMEILVEEAHRRGKIVAAHAHGTAGIKSAILAGADSIEHASFIDSEGIRLAKRNGTYLSMDIYVTEYILGRGAEAGILEENLAKERTVGKIQRENFRKAVVAGVKMVMGTDAGIYPHRESPRQLSRMVQFGMTPIQALQSATINAATLLKEQENFGSLRSGKYADIIAVRGDPLTNVSLLEDVSFVMKAGTIYKTP